MLENYTRELDSIIAVSLAADDGREVDDEEFRSYVQSCKDVCS